MDHAKKRFRKKPFQKQNPRLSQIIDNDIKELSSSYKDIAPSQITSFENFPLSSRTQTGLKDAGFVQPTEIQREAIGLALQGHDLLGAAKTGSGKTLAFLIPVLECLYREKWSSMDGVGALIVSPTRELAYQTFETLRQIGKKHDFSAGLVIGGKHLRDEAERISRTNIVICTPGRLLQHMDQTVNFNVDRLQMLVLDECDRILDLGFETTMNAIIANLPTERQTILFSATQTKSVKDLARLSLRQPVYVSVHENAVHSTPSQLDQSYVVCELHDKVSLLWFFIKHHLKCKILVFIQSCKQVRYLYEAFKRLRPGPILLCLHGAMQQLKRVSVYEQFCRKQHAVMFATDIAARGLDFPGVHWVVQLDCPEDANTYIHRVGRTARLEKDGESLLVLLPSEEEAMLTLLAEKKVPVNKIKVNPRRMGSIQGKLESQLAADPELKDQAKRAFVSYLRSVFLMSNKSVFDVFKLQTDAFARSLGLAVPPRIRFLDKQKRQREPTTLDAKADSAIAAKSKTGSEFMSQANDTQFSNEDGSGNHVESNDNFSAPDIDDDEEDDLLTVKQTHSYSANDEQSGNSSCSATDEESSSADISTDPDARRKAAAAAAKKALTKAALAKKLAKKNIVVNSKMVFDERGEAVLPQKLANQDAEDEDEPGGIDMAKAKARLRRADEEDKRAFRERVKRKHQEERFKQKELRRGKKQKTEDAAPEGEDEGETIAVLDTYEKFNPDELPDPYSSDGSASDNEGRATGPLPSSKANTSSESESDTGSRDGSVDSNPDDDLDSEAESTANVSNTDGDDDEDEDEQNVQGDRMFLRDEEELALKLLGAG